MDASWCTRRSKNLRSGAPDKLAIPRQTLESKIKSLGIDKLRFKAPQAH